MTVEQRVACLGRDVRNRPLVAICSVHFWMAGHAGTQEQSDAQVNSRSRPRAHGLVRLRRLPPACSRRPCRPAGGAAAVVDPRPCRCGTRAVARLGLLQPVRRVGRHSGQRSPQHAGRALDRRWSTCGPRRSSTNLGEARPEATRGEARGEATREATRGEARGQATREATRGEARGQASSEARHAEPGCRGEGAA